MRAGLNVCIRDACVDPIWENFILTNLSVELVITLVSNQDDRNLWVKTHLTSGLMQCVSPLFDWLIGLSISDVEDNYSTIRASVESLGQGLEPFLTCCVPYLQWNLLTTAKLNFLFDEVCTDRRLTWLHCLRSELETLNERRLANPRISNQDQLKVAAMATSWRWTGIGGIGSSWAILIRLGEECPLLLILIHYNINQGFTYLN